MRKNKLENSIQIDVLKSLQLAIQKEIEKLEKDENELSTLIIDCYQEDHLLSIFRSLAQYYDVELPESDMIEAIKDYNLKYEYDDSKANIDKITNYFDEYIEEYIEENID